jgi:hypothetical protein
MVATKALKKDNRLLRKSPYSGKCLSLDDYAASVYIEGHK